MRYVIQWLVPALVVAVVLLVALRNRGTAPGNPRGDPADTAPRGLGTGTFVAILIAAAIFTVVLVYELQAL